MSSFKSRGNREDLHVHRHRRRSVDDDGESVKLTFGNLPTGVSEGTTNETIISITDDDGPSVLPSRYPSVYTPHAVPEGSSVRSP